MRTLLISAVILTTVGLRSGPPLSAQPAPQSKPAARFLANLLENRYALSARGGQLSGAGAQVLRSAIAQSRPPKVLPKFGAVHVYRGLNPLHGSGIGNYVAEFAEAHGDQSLHIYLMPVKGSQPIWPRVSQPAQLRSFNHVDEARYRYLQPVFTNLLASEWTMFDLRPLRQEVAAPGGAIDAELATLVFGYDILVVVPDGLPSTEVR